MPYPKESLEEVFGLMYKVRNQRPRARVAAQAMLQTSASTVASPRPRLTKPPTEEKERSVNVLSAFARFLSVLSLRLLVVSDVSVLFPNFFCKSQTQITTLVEVTFFVVLKMGISAC